MSGTKSYWNGELNFSNAFSIYKWGRERVYLDTLDYLLKQVKFDGLYLEFGFGYSTELIGNKINPKKLYTFDCFEGIPNDWNGHEKGSFKVNTQNFSIPGNVEIIPGYYKETLSSFMAKQTWPIAFVNLDVDLYESTRDVLYGIDTLVRPGTIIYFDELYNYPDYKNHEYKALQEYCKDCKRNIRFIAYNDNTGAAIEVLK